MIPSVNSMQEFNMIGPNLKKRHWVKTNIRYCAIGLNSPDFDKVSQNWQI